MGDTKGGNMRISIFGYGVTTNPLVSFLNRQGHKLAIYDDRFKEIQKDKEGNTLLPSSEFIPQKSDQEILSPGIPPSHPLVQKAQNLISEYDYFDKLFKQNSVHTQAYKPYIVWISGTNGKTTTTEMTTLLLQHLGAQSGGNIGTPLATLYMQKPRIWILETSSFSLHYTRIATPRIYALLPVREDHITWHGSFENYIQDKLSPLNRMGHGSSALIPDELSCHPIIQDYQGTLISYKSSLDLGEKLHIDVEKVNFKEPFLLDALIALGIAKLSFKADDIYHLNTFQIGAHRIAEFYDDSGRLWVNDSKGTNIDATIEAIKRYVGQHIMIILGGDDKGANLTPLFDFMQDKDIEIISIGSNETRLIALAHQYNLPITPCQNLRDAMKHIHAYRKENVKDVVLLSPAAASLDQFASYQERGDLFMQLALHPLNA